MLMKMDLFMVKTSPTRACLPGPIDGCCQCHAAAVAECSADR